MNLSDKKVGVLMGGTSAEREVSLKSGMAVARALEELGIPHVEIDAGGDVCTRVLGEGIDLAFIALHGGWGEDGGIQGMLEVLGIPYTGSGVLASALAMDKEVSKKVFLYHGVNVPPFFVVRREEWDAGLEQFRGKGFALPLFVKPASEGSSIGARIVRSDTEYVDAVKEAFDYGEKILVEKYIKGREVQIGILGNRPLGGVEVRPKDEFYSFNAKYEAGQTAYILPPELSPELYERAQGVALAAHNALGCAGATRVDLIVEEAAEMYVLEVNTIPGMTETSLLPKIASLAGHDFKGLIREIIVDAFRRRGGER